MSSPILTVEDLRVSFTTEDGVVKRRRRSLVSNCPRARCWRSSANPVAARVSPRRR